MILHVWIVLWCHLSYPVLRLVILIWTPVWKYIATMLLLYRLRPMTTTPFPLKSQTLVQSRIPGLPRWGFHWTFPLQPPELFQSSGRFNATPSSLWTAMTLPFFFKPSSADLFPCSRNCYITQGICRSFAITTKPL